MPWLNLMAIIVSVLLIVVTTKYSYLRADRDRWRRKAESNWEKLGVAMDERNKWRGKAERIIASLREDIDEARLSHTCENCPPSVTVTDVRLAIDEARDKVARDAIVAAHFTEEANDGQ